MLYKTEYASNYIWHENAYSIKPERHCIRGRIRNCSLFSRHKGSLQQLSQPQIQQQQLLESVLYFPLHPSPRGQEDVVKEKVMDGNQMKISSETSPTRQKQRLSPARRYSLDADARGIKSHFLPADLEVLLDLGLNSCKSMSGADGNEANSVIGVGGDDPKCANQYFTSVYRRDFSCTNERNYSRE